MVSQPLSGGDSEKKTSILSSAPSSVFWQEVCGFGDQIVLWLQSEYLKIPRFQYYNSSLNLREILVYLSKYLVLRYQIFFRLPLEYVKIPEIPYYSSKFESSLNAGRNRLPKPA